MLIIKLIFYIDIIYLNNSFKSYSILHIFISNLLQSRISKYVYLFKFYLFYLYFLSFFIITI